MTPSILPARPVMELGRRVTFGGYFRIVDEPRPCGVMPMARRFGEMIDARETIPPLPRIEAAPLRLTNYRLWGFKSQAEMDAAFSDPAQGE